MTPEELYQKYYSELPMKLRVLHHIEKNHDTLEITLRNLEIEFKRSKSFISNILGKLKKEEVIIKERRGRTNMITITEKGIKLIKSIFYNSLQNRIAGRIFSEIFKKLGTQTEYISKKWIERELEEFHSRLIL